MVGGAVRGGDILGEDWALIYHIFGCAYGWTVREVDELTVPQALALVEKIKAEPPTNVLLSELLKAVGARRDGSKMDDVDARLNKFPNVEKKTGVKNLKLIRKKTGERLI